MNALSSTLLQSSPSKSWNMSRAFVPFNIMAATATTRESSGGVYRQGSISLKTDI